MRSFGQVAARQVFEISDRFYPQTGHSVALWKLEKDRPGGCLRPPASSHLNI